MHAADEVMAAVTTVSAEEVVAAVGAAAMAVVATVAEHTVLTHTHHYHRMDPRVWHPCSWADPQSE